VAGNANLGTRITVAPTDMEYPRIILKPKEEARLQRGHLWAFSNEVAQAPANLEPGALADLFPTHLPSGQAGAGFIGRGFYHPHSLIAFRILSSLPEEINDAFFIRRLNEALELRTKLFPGQQAYRWVFGESDRLPGLVVDRYGDYLAVQALSAGMERFRDVLIRAFEQTVHPKGIVWRSDAPVRALEGLKDEPPKVVSGEVPPRVQIETENGIFQVDLLAGQKTGFYFDQRDNRQALAPFCKGKRVLDAFCYSGGFGISAARAGAREIVFVDSSESALQLAEANAQLNGASDRCTVVQGDALQLLSHESPGGPFDVISVDPPAYARSKKHLPVALKAYEKLNTIALGALKTGGILASSSCSHFVSREMFLETLRRSARKAKKNIRVIELRGQAKDHPLLLAMPETEYLKFAILQVL
jgi:23S rRNA (cytosine1962-C5)-methyltransferase